MLILGQIAVILLIVQTECRSLLAYSLHRNSNGGYYNPLQEISDPYNSEQYVDDFNQNERHNEVSLQEMQNWPSPAISNRLKQVAGVHADGDGKVHIFHRGPNVWDDNSFDMDNVYRQTERGPIPNDTILVLDANTGDLISSWGKNKFYLPHGLTIDKDGNAWLTDVALHMVMKFRPGEEEPSLSLGEHLVPGSDTKHFCKPTDVAVASTGEFFVSDGYCNSRILKFKPDGELEQIIGLHDSLLVPHSLSLDEHLDQLCVADRDNFRVVCYSAGLKGHLRVGTHLFTIQPPHMGRVFSIKHAGKQLIAVTGDGADHLVPAEAALVLDIPQQELVETWRPPKGFRMPHDLSISPDNASVYIVDSDTEAPQKIYKLKFHSKK